VALAMAAASCSRAPDDDEAELARSNLSELLTADLVTGTGAEAVDGRLLRVHYTGWLYHPSRPDHKGREFDSSRRRGVPFEFRLGAGQVIRGWEDGVRGMRGGGVRRLTIPPSLAYGAAGAAGVIPPHATLVFEIELLEVR
jgi:FKBP-type peptidyl-prolyl cis-trans isomerase FkpA